MANIKAALGFLRSMDREVLETEGKRRKRTSYTLTTKVGCVFSAPTVPGGESTDECLAAIQAADEGVASLKWDTTDGQKHTSRVAGSGPITADTACRACAWTEDEDSPAVPPVNRIRDSVPTGNGVH